MAFNEVTSLDADTTISIGGFNKKTKKDNPTSAEGYYLGNRTVETKTGVSKLHFFKTADGNLGVWGKTDMDRKLSSVNPGTMTRVSFARMQETPKGDMYVYKVEVDSDNTIDVSLFTQNTSPAESAQSYDDGVDEDNADDETVDQDAIQEAALADAERRAKVREQLMQKGKQRK